MYYLVIQLETRLGYCDQPLPPTLVMEHYLQELVKIPKLQHIIGPIYCEFQLHLRTRGAHVAFPTSI